MRILCRLQLASIAVGIIAGSSAWMNVVHAEDGYGSISGQFIIDGPVPQAKILIQKCDVANLLDESLVVDKKTKGISNIFIYPRSVEKIHPSLKKTPKAKQLVIQNLMACKFTPRAMFIRTDQTVLVQSNDNRTYSVNSFPLRNMQFQFRLNPNAGVRVRLPVAERMPLKMRCDIYPSIESWWLVLDHPYAAVTNKKGEFTIEKLPVGEYEFRVWHEQTGYLGVDTKRGFKVKVESNKTTAMKPFQVPLEEFEEK